MEYGGLTPFSSAKVQVSDVKSRIERMHSLVEYDGSTRLFTSET